MNLFGKKDSAPVENNPYVNARRAWNDHVGSQVAATRNWQTLALISLMIVLVALGGVIYIGSQSKYIPYIVEKDKLGQVRAIGAVTASSKADSVVVEALLSTWISNARMVSVDAALQRKAVLQVYSMLTPSDPATLKMNEWLNGAPERNPFKRAETELVSIEIKNVIPQTKDSWQVDWLETARDRSGVVTTSPVVWRAVLTVYEAETTSSTTDDQLRANPLSLFIRDFSWSKVQ